MKTRKHLLLIGLLFLSMVTVTKAQETFLPDEIWYDTGKSIYIQFCLPSIYNLDQFSDASGVFPELFAESVQKQIQNYDRSKKISISIHCKIGETKITNCDENTLKYTIPQDLKPDSLSIYQELKIISVGGEKINCYFKNLDEMMSFLKDDWGKSIQLITAEFKNLPSGDKRKAIFVHFRQNGDRIENTFKELNLQVQHLDMLQLKGGVGFNFFKGKFMPSFDGEIGLVFSQKGILKNNYFMNIELMSDFITENNKIVPKTGLFVDLGYKRNFTKNPDKVNWYGFSIGYLFQKNAAVFDDNTWRLSIHRDISKNIELVPQIYFPDNFSKIFPGLKLVMSF